MTFEEWCAKNNIGYATRTDCSYAWKAAAKECVKIAIETPYRGNSEFDDAITAYEREVVKEIKEKFGLGI